MSELLLEKFLAAYISNATISPRSAPVPTIKGFVPFKNSIVSNEGGEAIFAVNVTVNAKRTS